MEKHLPFLRDLLRKASQEILKYYNLPADAQNRQLKADESPVTAADLAAHALISEAMQAAFPALPLFSEEGSNLSYEERRKHSRFWLLDPLDGTKEFVAGTGDFTINLAFVEEGRPTLGLVFWPLEDTCYWAWQGGGAWKQRGAGEVERLRAHTFEPGESGLRVTGSRSHFDARTQHYIETLNEPVILQRGSALKFLLIAEGRADVYPRCAPTMEWDTAAAQIIVEEAGGQLLDWSRGEPLRYNKPDLHNPYFICHGALAVAELEF